MSKRLVGLGKRRNIEGTHSPKVSVCVYSLAFFLFFFVFFESLAPVVLNNDTCINDVNFIERRKKKNGFGSCDHIHLGEEIGRAHV